MNIRILLGAGDQILYVTLPVALTAIILNIIFPDFFGTGLGSAGTILGVGLLVLGVPVWFAAGILVLMNVPRGKLITTGPFALVRHPIYTSVGLLVLPGFGFLLDSWIGLVIGLVLYFSSRIYSVKEDRMLEEKFSEAYLDYRAKVRLPWL